MGTMSNDASITTKSAQAFTFIANHTDTLNKTVKVLIPTLDIAINVLGMIPGGKGISAGLGMLKGRLRDTESVITATNIFERGYEWADPKKRGELVSKGWLNIAGRVALTAAQAMETIGFADKVSYGFLAMSALSFGGFTIFELVKNLTYVVSAIFGISAGAFEMIKANSDIRKASSRKVKYLRRQIELGDFDTFKLKKISDRYQQKLDDAQAAGASLDSERLKRAKEYIRLLNENASEDNFVDRVRTFQKEKVADWVNKCEGKLKVSEYLRVQINKLSDKLDENRIRIKYVPKADAQKVRDEMKEQQQKLSTLKKFKISPVKRLETYVKALTQGKERNVLAHKISKCDVRISNAKGKQTKSWLSLAVDIAKIVMITLGILVFSLTAFFNPAASLTVALVMAALSLISNSVGLAKNLHSSLARTPVEEPEFVLA